MKNSESNNSETSLNQFFPSSFPSIQNFIKVEDQKNEFAKKKIKIYMKSLISDLILGDFLFA